MSHRNVLLLIADDWSPIAGCYGNDIIKMPSVDALAARGTLFKHALLHHPHRARPAVPTCSPGTTATRTGNTGTRTASTTSTRNSTCRQFPKHYNPPDSPPALSANSTYNPNLSIPGTTKRAADATCALSQTTSQNSLKALTATSHSISTSGIPIPIATSATNKPIPASPKSRIPPTKSSSPIFCPTIQTCDENLPNTTNPSHASTPALAWPCKHFKTLAEPTTP